MFSVSSTLLCMNSKNKYLKSKYFWVMGGKIRVIKKINEKKKVVKIVITTLLQNKIVIIGNNSRVNSTKISFILNVGEQKKIYSFDSVYKHFEKIKDIYNQVLFGYISADIFVSTLKKTPLSKFILSFDEKMIDYPMLNFLNNRYSILALRYGARIIFKTPNHYLIWIDQTRTAEGINVTGYGGHSPPWLIIENEIINVLQGNDNSLNHLKSIGFVKEGKVNMTALKQLFKALEKEGFSIEKNVKLDQKTNKATKRILAA